MSIRTSPVPLQRWIQALPKPLRRIKVAQLLAAMTGSPYHRIVFPQGKLVGNVRDREVANSLVRGTFADYGYFSLAGRLLRAGDTHVDVGANYGFHTFGLLHLPVGPTIRYVLIDANPDCIACLAESARLHPGTQVQIFHAAAALAAGELAFTFDPSMTGGGHVGLDGARGIRVVRVPSSPLDELFAAHGIDHIGLMKMDIEGSETIAIKSLGGMLSRQGVDFIYFEVNPACLALQQTDALALFEEFARHGYRLFWPHDDLAWIRHTCGPEGVDVAKLRRATIEGREPSDVIEFDPSCYRKGQFGQCDLLAVSPRCGIALSQ